MNTGPITEDGDETDAENGHDNGKVPICSGDTSESSGTAGVSQETGGSPGNKPGSIAGSSQGESGTDRPPLEAEMEHRYGERSGIYSL